MVKCTIYKNAFDKSPFYISVSEALKRIGSGKSKLAVEEIRCQLDKERQDELKKNLPSVCFSGIFKERKDELIISHTGFIVLDFDNIYEVEKRKLELCENKYTYACWISPRNNGLKVLVKIADGKKHIEHFEALREIFPEADKSGRNVARLCFESYDPLIYINENSETFKKVKEVKKIEVKQNIEDEKKIFDNILKWLSNKGDAFVTGERNIFIFKLASACCRFGLTEEITKNLILSEYEIGENKFTYSECERTILSAYRANKQLFNTAQFDKDVLVDKVSRFEIEITQEMLDENIKPKDVVFGEDVKEDVLKIFNNGYERVRGIGVPEIDCLFKFKECEITLLSGYGNYGKSSFLAWMLIMRAVKYGEKFALFSPENLAHEFYHDLTEILLGCSCLPDNPNRPSNDEFQYAYDFISKHFFYVYPKTLDPTPQYIKERFLELIIKEKINGAVIDPFNQLTNDYKGAGGRTDKYLETFLSDCARFAQQNNIYFMIVAHPTKPKSKDEGGNYPMPDVFDIADGAMWNNKMDNIVIYHRPVRQTSPDNDSAIFSSKKIRRQKVVGKPGEVFFNMKRVIRRFTINDVDLMAKAISESQHYKQLAPVKPQTNFVLQPSKLFDAYTPINQQEAEPPF